MRVLGEEPGGRRRGGCAEVNGDAVGVEKVKEFVEPPELEDAL